MDAIPTSHFITQLVNILAEIPLNASFLMDLEKLSHFCTVVICPSSHNTLY